MKKITKLLALTLAIVMLCTVLAACSLIGTDVARYRNVVAFTVGDEDVTIGTIIDAYSTNVYSYYSYISAGYSTYEEVFSSTMSELYQKYIMLDSYKQDSSSVIYTSSENKYISLGIANMEYLTEEEAEFVLSNMKHTIFTTLDSYVEGYITAEVGDLADVEDDTSREFTELDSITTGQTYTDYLISESYDVEDINEYFDEYYSMSSFDRYELEVDSYVYSTTDAAAMVASINERLEDATEDGDEVPTITAEDYIAWQELAMEEFAEILDTNYGAGFESYMYYQSASTIVSIINNKWSYSVASAVETDIDTIKTDLEAMYTAEYNAYQTSINQNPDSYISFITDLGTGDYIYDVPSLYEDDFIFVKNILFTFSDAQSAELSAVAEILGGTDSDEYKAYRLSLVESIIGTDYNSDDEDELTDIFLVDDGNITLNPDASDSTLYDTLTSGDLTEDDIKDLMVQYNEDTASHSITYDYVVYTGALDSYTHSWVDEFVDAAIEAQEGGVGSYAICVSDYGVHIVYYVSDIEPWTEFDFSKIYDSENGQFDFDASSNEYAMYKSYYSALSSILYTEVGDELNDEYLYGGKVVEAVGLSYLLEELGLEYDFDDAITDPDEEDE